MKILYHHRTLSKDGQNVHIEELIAAFRRAGHEIHIVGPTAHRRAEFGSDGGLLSRIRHRLPRALGEMLELCYSVLAFWRLARAYGQFRPDALYERYNLFLLAGAWLQRLTGIPFALEINAPLAEERRTTSGLSLCALAHRCESYVWKSADLALPVTSVLANDLIAAGVKKERISVIPNGIDGRHFSPALTGEDVRRRYGLAHKTVVGFTGFLREWHGLPAIVDVIRELSAQGQDLQFLVVGDGPGRPALERAAVAAGLLDRITITGVVDRSEIPLHVAAFDIAVQPKATAYASPLKLFEYMALGRAILAPDQPNIREVLVHEDNAILFAPDDVASFRDALARLVADRALQQRLGTAAARSVSDLALTWDGNAHKIAAALAGLIQARARAASGLADRSLREV